jgi:hypothetical protein
MLIINTRETRPYGIIVMLISPKTSPSPKSPAEADFPLQ